MNRHFRRRAAPDGPRAVVSILLLAAACVLLQPGPIARAADASAPPVIMTPLPPRPVIAPVMDCRALAQRDFTGISDAPTSIAEATIEPASAGRAEFCVVKGVISPQIQFELRLPTRGYTDRYLQGGCGGACGFISSQLSPPCEDQLAFGGSFAVAFENSGHVGANMIDTVWALHAPALRKDFADRAAHVTSVAAKAIIAAYYGVPPAYAYFQGCSDGGREGLKEAQDHPGDFDGIVVGAPAYWISLMPLRIIWESQHAFDALGQPLLTKESVTLLHAAVLAACDRLDGLQDGQIDDSRQCHYDPRKLICRPGQSAGCITAAQAEAMRAYYSGPLDADGRQLYLGGEPYGSELTWTEAFSLMGGTLGANQIKYMIYDGDPPANFDWRTWKPDASTLADLFRRGGYYNADNSDLSAFRRSGAKLIIWQGAADNAAGPYGVFDYYQRVRDKLGGFAGTRPFMRVFVIPGVYHCRGGYLPYQEDFLGPMVNWVELKTAPDSVVASAVLADGSVRRRPVYAYPAKARYKGAGDVNDPTSFEPETPTIEPSDRYDWLGAGLY